MDKELLRQCKEAAEADKEKVLMLKRNMEKLFDALFGEPVKYEEDYVKEK